MFLRMSAGLIQEVDGSVVSAASFVCFVTHIQSSHRASPLPTQSKTLLYVITQRTVVPRSGHLPSTPGVLERYKSAHSHLAKFGCVVSLVDTCLCVLLFGQTELAPPGV